MSNQFAFFISLTVWRRLWEPMNAFNRNRHFSSSQRISKDKTSEFITTIRKYADNMFRLSLLKNLSANYDYLGRCRLPAATFWTHSTISNQFVWIKRKGFPRYKSIASKTNSKIVWIDLEMTGLSVENDRIMEIACIITDKHLNILAEHPALVINQPDSLLDTMTEWCTTTHTQVWACTPILVSFTPANVYVYLPFRWNRRGYWTNVKSQRQARLKPKSLCWISSPQTAWKHSIAHWLAIPFTWIGCSCGSICRASTNISITVWSTCHRWKNCANAGTRHFLRKYPKKSQHIEARTTLKRALKRRNSIRNSFSNDLKRLLLVPIRHNQWAKFAMEFRKNKKSSIATSFW